MGQQRKRVAELDCIVVDALPEGRGPSALVVLCHGYGAPGIDLVPLAGELLRLNPKLAGAVRFVFPAGLLSLDEMGIYGGRAWWQIDVNRLVHAVETGEFTALRTENPEGLATSRERLTTLVDMLLSETGLSASKLVLGGFSQGAMLTTDVALRMKEQPGGLAVLSGVLLAEEHWKELAAKRGPMPVVQSHGTLDQILPYAGGEWLRDLLTEAGLPVEFVRFAGPHTIPFEAVDQLAGLIARVAGVAAKETGVP